MKIIAPLLAAILCASLARAEPPPLPLPWQKVTELFVTPSPSRMYGPDNAVYVQTHLPTNYGPQQTGVWHTVDLKPLGVSADALSAFLSGILIITHGETEEIADLRVVFRRPGDTVSCDKYLGQVTEAHRGGGQRSGLATWVPLDDGKFEFCYQISTPGAWPTNSSYAINLSIQAWAR